jgi:hypothetical protein
VPGPEASPAPADPPDGGLPVRVPQASLAPQLRDRDATDSGASQAPPVSAEAVRSTMSAMQSGWERARSSSAEPPADPTPGEEE